MKQVYPQQFQARSMLKALSAVLFVAASALVPAHSAFAQAGYPDKPIKLVLAFPPGGPTDLVARVLAQKVGEQMGQAVVVENKPGANGNIAAALVAKAPADGYTVFYNTSAIALSPALYKNLGYDAKTDFAPVALTAVIPLVLAVHPSVPANTLGEFFQYLKTNGDKVSYGSAGNGNVTHLGAFMLLKSQGLNIQHVPYKGSAPALLDVVAGQTQFVTDTVNSALPFIKDKRLKALAVTSLQRASVLPDVPTVNEAAVKGFEVGAWQGVVVPARTSPEIVKRLNAEIMKALGSADVKAKLAAQGAVPLGSTPEAYGKYLKSEIDRWQKVVQEAGVTVQ
ncbi:Bug family tripartite tricarboxylate transporter substrate binding protein [Lacisediminimonas profundi]|uniref:Bug family tripartite tricarboxylate transporter substrate binding protein n=1 Tax=Lacisediminimonas profundi TaxID=2603856 RepID=UPI00138740D3|nr:tripartite tricarboxylate transporter substrate binding protein [Lacisediminimonas profundi]